MPKAHALSALPAPGQKMDVLADRGLTIRKIPLISHSPSTNQEPLAAGLGTMVSKVAVRSGPSGPSGVENRFYLELGSLLITPRSPPGQGKIGRYLPWRRHRKSENNKAGVTRAAQTSLILEPLC